MRPAVSFEVPSSVEGVGHPEYDLLLRLPELGGRLAESVARAEWLDAFLFAAAMNQIAEDSAHDRLGRYS